MLLVFVSFLVLALFSIVLYRLYLSISLPLGELIRVVRRYWSGDFSARVAVAGQDSLSYLQQSFNEMAEKIERMLNELKQLDELKSEFVSTVSHELRTPLTSIGGYVNLILDEEAGPINGTQKEFLQIVDRNVERLARLIDDLLDSERMLSGRFEVRKDRIRLEPILAECAQTVAVLASKKGLQLRFESRAPEAEVLAERPRLYQIFMNLLHNAVKYTEHGEIELRLEASDFSAVVQVRDTGVGLTPEEQGRVFDRFYRTRGGLSSSEGGTGLGLAITRGLVESFAGQVTVESEVGKGSVFTVTLPLAPV
jgi:signal transduction histidine kinase